MDSSSINLSRFFKYELVIRNKNIKEANQTEGSLLISDDRKCDSYLKTYREIKVNELLRSIGDDKRFQIMVLSFLCIFNFFYSFIIFQLHF